MENLISKIKIENEEILIKIIDMKYLYKRKSENIKREQRVFIFGLKENLEFKLQINSTNFYRFYI